MIIRYASDLHLERFWVYKIAPPLPEKLPEDSQSVYVLAGDILEGFSLDGFLLPWLEMVSRQFAHVLIVLGNHDMYGHDIDFAHEYLQEAFDNAGLENVRILQDDFVIIDRVKFVGATLWTDFKKNDPLVIYRAPSYMMKDYKMLKLVGASVNPYQLIQRHNESLRFILTNTKRDESFDKLVVITHHGPSYQSVHERFRQRRDDNEIHNWYFVSDLESRIYYNPGIDLWIHGHVHNCFDYELLQDGTDTTRVVCNPHGQTMMIADAQGKRSLTYENKQYNPLAKVEL